MHKRVSRIRTLVAYVLLYTLFAAGASLFPPTSGLGTILLSAMAGSLVGIALVYAFSDLEVDWKFAGLLVALGTAVDFLGNSLPRIATGPVIFACLIGLANLGLLTAATGAGLLVAKGLRQTSYLVLAALVGAIADVYSVSGGPTKHLVKTEAVYYLSFQWGLVGRGGISPIVGMADFIFLALFFAGARKFGWNSNKTLAAMAAAFVVGLLLALIHPAGLPALPFMSAALVTVHKNDLKMSREDWLKVIKLTIEFAIAMALIVLRRKFM